MKRTLPSESGLSGIRLLTVATLCLGGSLLAYASFAASPSSENKRSGKTPAVRSSAIEWQKKVDSSVLAAAGAGPTEFIVYMAQQADLSGAAALATKNEKGAHVYERLTSVAEATQPAIRQLLSQLGAEYKSFWVSNSLWAKGDLALLQTLASRPEVAAIQPVGRGELRLPSQPEPASPATPSSNPVADVDPEPEPNLLQVNADDVWAMGFLGQGVVVASADTGVFWTHAALKNRYRGWNGTTASHDYNWHDAIHTPNAFCPGDSPQPCDDDEVLGGGHGSHTTGTMVGDDGANDRVGMAPEANWIACRNLNSGLGVVPTYMECMQFFIAPTKIDGSSPDTTKAPHVVNNSWGCVEGCPQPLLQDVLRASRAAGIFYAVSAGNDGNDCNTLQFPLARYPESFTVGATDHRNDTIAGFSSRGPVVGDPDFPGQMILKPNISAPGVRVRSAQRDGTYALLSGTSMAGPHVAGLVALIISANPALAGNIDRIEDIIEQSAASKTTSEACGMDSATAVPNNTYGWGRIDALAAVNLALADAGPALVKVASRKIHDSAGAFDIPLSVGGLLGIESRSGQPAEGNHAIVFTFASPVTLDGSTTPPASAATMTGAGSVSSISVNGDAVTVNLNDVTNAQRIGLTLNNVSDGTRTGKIAVSMGVLLADANSSARVDAGDLTSVRQTNLQPLTEENFRNDVNASGRIDSGDVLVTRQQNLTELPPE